MMWGCLSLAETEKLVIFDEKIERRKQVMEEGLLEAAEGLGFTF